MDALMTETPKVEYTPSMEQLRDAWRAMFYEGVAPAPAVEDAEWDDERMYAQYDRALAAHDPERDAERDAKLRKRIVQLEDDVALWRSLQRDMSRVVWCILQRHPEGLTFTDREIAKAPVHPELWVTLSHDQRSRTITTPPSTTAPSIAEHHVAAWGPTAGDDS
jgi:hypothetical protein